MAIFSGPFDHSQFTFMHENYRFVLFIPKLIDTSTALTWEIFSGEIEENVTKNDFLCTWKIELCEVLKACIFDANILTFLLGVFKTLDEGKERYQKMSNNLMTSYK